MKLREYITYWYRTYRKPGQQVNTQECFESLLRNHIFCNPIADMEMEDITIRNCQEFLTQQFLYGNKRVYKGQKQEDKGLPLTAHTVKKIRQVLVAVFRQAVKERLVMQNVAECTEPVSIPWKDTPVFTPETQKKFLETTKNHRFYPAYVLLFFLGCRRSEILGLTWDSIDLRKNIVKIRKVLVLENKQIVLKARTKTKASIRTIPIPQEIKNLLQEWKQRQKLESHRLGYKNTYNLVFTNSDGSPHNPIYFSRNFKEVIKKLACCSNDLHMHSARHTWATNMIHYGISITDVQAIGGWSRPDTLLNIYAHTVKKSHRKAINKIFKELNG